MWHEARKNERNIRKAIVNYRKRAERKHDYYDKIKQDPIKFMQVHGRRCKLHINENEIEAMNSMVAWQGDKTNMIDRFDVRAHLDIIRENDHPDISLDKEDRKLNFERYRNLVYNKYKGTSERSHLQQIRINESFPEAGTQRQDAEAKKKLLASSKASIAFNYDEDQRGGATRDERREDSEEEEEDEHDILSDEEFWREMEEIPPLKDCPPSSLNEMEAASLEFGMCYGDFAKSLTHDQNIQNKMDRQKEIESQKQKMAGKKSRRERRMLKDNRLKGRVIGPLTYIYREEEEENNSTSSDSDSIASSNSRSSSGEDKGDGIEFITSFGENSSTNPPKAFDSSSKSQKTKKTPKSKSPDYKPSYSSRRDSRRYSRSRSRSGDGKYHSRRYSRSRSPENYPWKSAGRTKHKRSRSRTRSRSSERRYPWQRSRSRSRSPQRRPSSSKSGDRYRRRSSSREKSPVRNRPVATLKSTPVSKTAVDVKKLTPQEKLKVKMQRALKKQLKTDKIALADKRAQVHQEQLEREEDLRMMARRGRKGDYRDSPPPRRSLHDEYR